MTCHSSPDRDISAHARPLARPPVHMPRRIRLSGEEEEAVFRCVRKIADALLGDSPLPKDNKNDISNDAYQRVRNREERS